MKSFILVFVFMALASFGRSALGQEPLEFFLKVDGVKGDATSDKFKDQIVVTGFSVGTTNTAGAVGNLTGKASQLPLVVQKNIDKASPVLAQHAATGEPFQKAELFVLTAHKGEFVLAYTITLENVKVVGAQTGGDIGRLTGRSQWMETVAFQYGSIQWAFGTTKAGYDFAGAKKLSAAQNVTSPDAASVADAPAAPAATGTVAVNYSRTDAGHVSLSFDVEADKTYRVLGSQTVDGPYQTLTTYSAAETRQVVLSVGANAPTEFFRIEAAQ